MVSRYLKSLARRNISENPVVSIIARLLCMQVNNAVVAHRLFEARKDGVLLEENSNDGVILKGYSTLRHRVTQCQSFVSFTRLLAKDWVMNFNRDEKPTEDESSGKRSKLVATFSRNAAELYNVGTHKAGKSGKRIANKHISGPVTYCVLCSWSLRGLKDGNLKIKRKESGQIQ